LNFKGFGAIGKTVRNNATKKLVLFFDAFQCIGEIAARQSMESVLRQVVQLTQSISFVFSGSNRL
jgi:hypothetical protein